METNKTETTDERLARILAAAHADRAKHIAEARAVYGDRAKTR